MTRRLRLFLRSSSITSGKQIVVYQSLFTARQFSKATVATCLVLLIKRSNYLLRSTSLAYHFGWFRVNSTDLYGRLLLCFGVISVEAQNQQFRKDYKYLAETQSFYKIHTIHRTWKDAKNRCALEGAKLFYPVDQEEANAVIALWNTTQPSLHWIYIGVSDLLSKYVFETIDGTPIDDVYNHWSPGEPNDADGVEDCVVFGRTGVLNDDACHKRFPFICKKRQDAIQWNVFCDMPYPSYFYNAELGKCYKFHLNPLNWTTAYGVCAAELSYLTIINSDKEADFLVQMTAAADKDNVSGNYMRGVVALGFHNRDQEGWKTSKGK
ncbi:Collectin-10 [Eumeta japonica]|uniref:Collectin-10 n=1 Tax=Eumeta variegata TaxID=151549 RepID=A0A4C1UF33_EUMVA|nr:Collectin-10 [Eumeta japonica]